MKKVQLLSTVAAALLFAAGAVSAQNMKKDEAPAAQQKAPAEKLAPPMRHSERKAPETTGQATQGTKSGEHKTHETTGQAPSKTSEPDNGPIKHQTMDKGSEQHRATTGQGAAAGSAKLSTEQRSKITTIFRRHKVAPVHLNVSVRVGTRIPASVHFYPLPLDVVAIYPEWRGYDYILVGDEIVVIDPRTHEIVAILEA
jgi:Protein of unknown function (DUF1236)